MKFPVKHSFLLLIITTLIACTNANNGSEGENTIHSQHNIVSENRTENDTIGRENVSNKTNNDQNFMKEQLQASYFKKIEIEVTYANELQFEAEIQEDDGFIKAKIEDDLKKNELAGIEAFEIIFSKIDPLNIQSDTDHQTIIDQVIAKFRLPIDYKAFELEIEFHDGKELKIEQEI